MLDLGPPLATCQIASASPSTPAATDARLWLPADVMYALRLEAGTTALVGMGSSAAGDAPTPLLDLFGVSLATSQPGACDAAASSAGSEEGEQEVSGPQPQQQLGSLVVAAELWPMQGLQKGTALPSLVLRDALARPAAGARLLVYCVAGPAVGCSSSGEGSAGAGECACVYLRMWQQADAAGVQLPALLPSSDQEAAGRSSQEGREEADSPAAVTSPAMRSRRSTPAVLSPAMQGGAAQPVGLARTGSRGSSRRESGGASPAVSRSAGGIVVTDSLPALPATPSASTGSVQMDSDTRPGNASRVQSRAKAEALLAALGSKGCSSRLRLMAEALLLRQLAGRRLLPGNLVTLPLFGQQAVFVVEHTVRATPAAAPAQDGSAAGHAMALPTLPVTAATKVCLLLGDEAAPDPLHDSEEQQEDWAAKAAAAAAEALGCTLEDVGALAAYRAAEAGMVSGGVTFDELGGAAQQAQALRELLLPLQAPEMFARYHITPPHGMLLYGPPGTGKTMLARATATQAQACFLVINGPDVVSEYLGESEAGLRGIFAAARALAPSIIFIDEIDALAPSRSGSGGSQASSASSARLVATLLTEMDQLGAARVVVVAATNRPDALDDSLRRPGRFDREVEVGAPSRPERLDILTKQLRSMSHSLTPSQVADLADDAHGFVAADLAALCREAAMIALRRIVAAADTEGSRPCITLADFKAAETRTRPSAMRELAFEVPKVTWDDIGGLDDVKEQLKETVELPFQNPEAVERLGIIPPRGVLLYGPPGCSKTLLARAVASQTKLNFISIKGPELFNKYVGESEKALASVFAKARASSPAIIFFDEIDGMVTARDDTGNSGVSVGDRVLSQLLQEMDGLQARAGVIVIGATNRPDCLDPALLRPGRFDRIVHVPPPDLAARVAIFAVHTRCMPLAPDVDLDYLAQQGDGFTGATIAACCREAALAALEEDIEATCVAMHHFNLAVDARRLQQSDHSPQSLPESFG